MAVGEIADFPKNQLGSRLESDLKAYSGSDLGK